MSGSYRVQQQEDGSYIVRFGWRAVAYHLSADEHHKLDIVQHQIGFAGIILGVIGFLFFDLGAALAAYQLVAVYVSLFMVLSVAVMHYLEKRVCRGKQPLDVGLTYHERFRLSALHRWENRKGVYIFLLITLLIRVVLEVEPVGVLLALLVAGMILQSLYYRYV